MPQFQIGNVIITALVAGLISASVLLASLSNSPTQMSISPLYGTSTINETFTVAITIRSDIPVNAFKGIVYFDASKLYIESINYNTSIADLWAEEPWYSNGDGTLSFIGGTTKKGGFIGEGELVTVTFKSIRTGQSRINLSEVRILQHDGLGTDAEVAAPIDALFTVSSETLDAQTVETAVSPDQNIVVLPVGLSTDLNKDGLQNIIDISIFMRDLSSQNKRSDFNSDGVVGTSDLSIILQQ